MACLAVLACLMVLMALKGTSDLEGDRWGGDVLDIIYIPYTLHTGHTDMGEGRWEMPESKADTARPLPQ